MITKIYNGVKFKSNNWKEVLDQLTSIRSEAIEIANNSIDVKKIIGIIELEEIDLENSEGYIEMFIFDKLKESIYQCRKLRVKTYFNFSIILYPDKEGDIYGYYFNELNEHPILLKPFTEDYAYWDNSDAPEDMEYEDFRKRGDKWDELITGTFIESGFDFKLVTKENLDRSKIYPLIKQAISIVKRDDKINEILDSN